VRTPAERVRSDRSDHQSAMPVATRRKSLTSLLSRLPRQLVYDIFTSASAMGPAPLMDTRALIRRETLKTLEGFPSFLLRNICAFVPLNSERFEAFLVTVGMASLRSVSTSFRDLVDEMAARENFAEFGVWHVGTTIPANSVEDRVRSRSTNDPQLRNAIRLRQGAPWAALAERVRAVVAFMTAVLAHDSCNLDIVEQSHESWQTWLPEQENKFARAFVKTAWTTPWVVDATSIWITKFPSKADFDADHPRCVALREFALSLAPPSSVDEIKELPSGETDVLFHLFEGNDWAGYCIARNELNQPFWSEDDPSHALISFCAFTLRPNDDDFKSLWLNPNDRAGLYQRRGGHAVRVADLCDPKGGSIESVQRWQQFWAQDNDSDRDYDDDFDSDGESSYIDYTSFERPFSQPPIVLHHVTFDFEQLRPMVELQFQFADTAGAYGGFILRVTGAIQLKAGGLCFRHYHPNEDSRLG